jgi:murein DD-endopeptidase MepM/ murein hydrolase activator NlpD
MRYSPLVLALSLLGMSGSLEAAKPVAKATAQSGVHRIRKGETAAKVARQFKLSLAQLEDLNPDHDLDRLSVGALLRVTPDRKSLRALTASPKSSGLAKVYSPVTPLPGTPSLRPGPLVHLERVLPSTALLPVPDGRNLSDPEATENHKAMAAQMQPVLPKVAETETATQGFEAADPAKLDLLWPVETRTISSAWGPRVRTRTVRVKTKTSRRKIRQRYQSSHRGVDLTAPKGTDVYAAMDGRVVEAQRHKDYGNYVVLDHGNGVTTLYAHHKLNYVRTGDVVRRGQKIAEVGSTGKSTGPHLHFELRFDGDHQNPLPMLNDVEEIPAELMAQNEAAIPPRRPRR